MVMAADLTERPGDIIVDLLRVPFSRRSFAEKNDIITKGRPTPKMDELTKRNKGFVRRFAEGNYQRYEWISSTSDG